MIQHEDDEQYIPEWLASEMASPSAATVNKSSLVRILLFMWSTCMNIILERSRKLRVSVTDSTNKAGTYQIILSPSSKISKVIHSGAVLLLNWRLRERITS